MTRLRDKKTGQLVTTHGHSKRRSPEYNAWSNMRQRCNNPQATGYSDYGGRGITVCSRWDSFEAFLEDMGNKPSPKHSLDRINNAGEYGPGNCRWATRLEQNRNTRSSRLDMEKVLQIHEMFRLGKTCREIAAHFGISHQHADGVGRGNSWADAALVRHRPA